MWTDLLIILLTLTLSGSLANGILGYRGDLVSWLATLLLFLGSIRAIRVAISIPSVVLVGAIESMFDNRKIRNLAPAAKLPWVYRKIIASQTPTRSVVHPLIGGVSLVLATLLATSLVNLRAGHVIGLVGVVIWIVGLVLSTLDTPRSQTPPALPVA